MNRRTFMAATVAAGGMVMTGKAQARQRRVRFGDVVGSPRLHIRNLRNHGAPPVLYVHGATFPSALSVGYRFADGGSWEGALHRAGFDPWAFDFEGFGGSDRPPAFAAAADASPIPLRAVDAAQQIARAVRHVLAATGAARLSIISHSWGTIPASRFACDHPELVDRLVLFGPILPRQPSGAAPGNNLPASGAGIPAWRLLTVAEQRARFINDTPPGHANVLAEPDLAQWGPAWLATDPDAASRMPPAVKVPTGPQADILASWGGGDLYDPRLLRCPTLLVRGEWDSLSTAADAERLRTRIAGPFREAVILESGHLAHIETNRTLLWSAINTFLREGLRR
ncbi:alpha/beta hydrolase [Novosphingobium sp.]|uniref:alpha/beta fold hydrolase n=1 Tax=Novosphingobium sp. TaxID=1874826 RepID=UPI002600DCB9|nr:alpha/beta hydrolase [Novosphingobium sp.]